MKKLIYFVSIVAIVVLAMAIAGCAKKPTYQLTFPSISEDDGYAIDINGEFDAVDENKYWVFEGKSVTFTVRTLEGFTFNDNIDVRNNGEAMQYTRLPSGDDERYEFKLNNIREAHTITVSGVEGKKYNLTLNAAKYRESASDTEGIIYTEYNPNTLKVKYGNTVYPSLTQAINAINNAKIQLEYKSKFEIWIGESYTNYYTISSFFPLYLADSGFNGIIREKSGDEYNPIEFNNSGGLFPETDDTGTPIYQNNMYKFVFYDVKQDINLYLDTMALRKNNYSAEYVNCEVYEVETPISMEAGESWTLRVKTKAAGYEGVDYSNMKVCINGYDITANMYTSVLEPNTLLYAVNRPTPSAYNPNEVDTYHITVEGIDVSAYQLTKLKVHPNENVGNVNYYGLATTLPFYYENGYYYYKKDIEGLSAFFSPSLIYNYDDMQIKINGVLYTGYDISSDTISINIIPEAGGYLDEYNITISGVVKAQYQYTIKNDYSSAVNLYLEYNGNRTLVTAQQTLTLTYMETFYLELSGKTEGQDISQYTFAGYDEKENGGTSNIDVSPTTIRAITIVAYETTAPQNRTITITK